MLLETHDAMSALQSIELSFGILAKSFVEFEKDLLDYSIDEAFPQTVRTPDFGAFHERANLKVATLLTCARSYHDQRPRNLKIGGWSEIEQSEIRDAFSQAFDGSFAYRLVEALRNYAQHSAMPIGAISFKSSMQPKGVDPRKHPVRDRRVVTVLIKKEDILENRKKLRAQTMSELEGIDKKYVDLRYLLRSYISEVAKAHLRLRELTEARLIQMKDESETIISKYMGADIEIAKGVLLVNNANPVESGKWIGSKYYRTVVELRERWVALQSATNRFVSSELTSGDKVSFLNDSEVYLAE